MTRFGLAFIFAGLALARPASPATLTLPPVTVTAASACPEADGSAGATLGTAQYPTALNGYARTIHELGCQTPGIDYRVGLPEAPALIAPTATNLPAGCSLASSIVTCTGNNLTIQGYDFTNRELSISGANNLITHNLFSVGAACLAPIRYTITAGNLTISYNTIDGGGATCSSLASSLNADVWGCSAAPGTALIYQYNWQRNIGEDGLQICGTSSASGPLTVTYRYNLIDQQGWRGHPDGIQLTRGYFANFVLSHNTYIKTLYGGGSIAGTQPFHLEAQLTSTITNSTVAYNTMITPGACNGGVNWPSGCSVNFDIACKQDSGNVNTGFTATHNYIDPSGAIAGLSNAYACQATTWTSNYNMQTGALISP